MIERAKICYLQGKGHQNLISSDRLYIVVALAILVSIWCPKKPEIEYKAAKR